MPPQIEEQRELAPRGSAEALARQVEARSDLPVSGHDALVAVLSTLAERLTGGAARRMLARLPEGLAAELRPFATHGQQPEIIYSRPEMMRILSKRLGVDDDAAERGARAVFAALAEHLGPERLRTITSELPVDLRALFPTARERKGRAAERLPPESRRILEASGALPVGLDAAHALSIVVGLFSLRLSAGEVHALADQLPIGLRRRVTPLTGHRHEAPDLFGARELVQRVAARLGVDEARAEALTRAALHVVRRALPPAAVRDAASQLPEDLQALWLAPPPSPTAAPEPAEARPRGLEERLAGAGLPEGIAPHEALGAVACVLSRCLGRGEAERLVNALPERIRAQVRSCTRHGAEPRERPSAGYFGARVAEHLGVTPSRADAIARAVLPALRDSLPVDEAQAIASEVPAEIADLFRPPEEGPGQAASGAAGALTAPPEGQVRETEVFDPLVSRLERSALLPKAISGSEAVSAVLCELSRRLAGGEAFELLRALPENLRPLFRPCVLHRGEAPEHFDRAELRRRLARQLRTSEENAERIATTVFGALQERMPAEAADALARQLPEDLRTLWSTGP
jgi:uncharacterized protein (DUF2267 family)